MKFRFTCLLICFGSVASLAAAPPPPEDNSSSSFEIPAKKFLIKPFFLTKGNSLRLTSITDSGKEVQWDGNYRAELGASVNYSDLIGVSFGGKGPLTAEDQSKKGDTTYSDFRFRFPWRQWMLELSYATSQGFYASNTNTFSNSSDYIKMPNLFLENLSIESIYVFDPSAYSLASAFDQTEIQTQTSGSFIGMLQVVKTRFNNDQPVIPTALASYFGNESQISSGSFYALNIGAGYGHNRMISKYNQFTFQILAGLGYQDGYATDSTSQYPSQNFSGLLRFDIGLQHNTPLWVFGAQLNADAVTYRTGFINHVRTLTEFALFIGYRL